MKGKLTPIPRSNMPLAAVGVLLLWLGWFAFNGGSVLSADPEFTSFTLVTTCLAAAAGCVTAMFVSWTGPFFKPDLSMAVNGVLAGLVGITAGADTVSLVGAIAIGVIAGGLVVGSIVLLGKIKVDDPVGVISVHLTCGVWGTLAVGIFSTNPEHTLAAQATGGLAYGLATLLSSTVLFGVIQMTLGLRVSENPPRRRPNSPLRRPTEGRTP